MVCIFVILDFSSFKCLGQNVLMKQFNFLRYNNQGHTSSQKPAKSSDGLENSFGLSVGFGQSRRICRLAVHNTASFY